MANVRFFKTTKKKYLNRDAYDSTALYFCEDTGEMFKGEAVYTDGFRVVPTHADLPECPCAADGVVYYVTETRNGYVMAPDRSGWLQTIYAPAEDVTTIPESEIYNTVTTVGSVRDIENAIYKYIDDEIDKIELNGASGKDGISITKSEINANGELVFTFSDGQIANVGKVVGKDGINGVNGKDGYTPVKGVDYFDGQNGKDGLSAYEIWINTGHSGSEDDFLQWLKGDNDPFGNVVTSIECNGIAAGTSLNGKTVKDVLVMLLGIKEAPKSLVEYIMDNSIPMYSGTANGNSEVVEYKLLDMNTSSYADSGFYTATDSDGNITNAGYQVIINGNSDADAQTFSMIDNAVIKMAYRYDLGGTNTWLAYTFDVDDEANYWLPSDTFTATVNGEEVVYQTYTYNIDVVGGGDAITSTEYWRFEIEVTN